MEDRCLTCGLTQKERGEQVHNKMLRLCGDCLKDHNLDNQLDQFFLSYTEDDK